MFYSTSDLSDKLTELNLNINEIDISQSSKVRNENR